MRVTTIWSVEKYYERLEQMRDAYDAWLSDNSSVSDGVEQLFFDPRDTWVADASSLSPQVSEALQKHPYEWFAANLINIMAFSPPL